MKAVFRLLILAALATPTMTFAHLYVVTSPTHEQTFAYGSEQHQAWLTHGPDRHVALTAEFTNDPYVDRTEPRQYDDFLFDFPSVRLGADGRTFYFRAPGDRLVAVAEYYRDFLGIHDVRLLDNAVLVVKSPHGYLSLDLLISDRGSSSTASL